MPRPGWEIDYKHPGALKARVTLFWLENYKKDTTKQVVDKCESMLKEHGIGLDVYPSRTIDAKFIIPFKKELALPDDYNDIRCQAAKIYDDQKTASKLQRFPVIFGEFKGASSGITTQRDNWLPYCFISGHIASDAVELIHEMIHAAGTPLHLAETKTGPKNVMEDNPTRTTVYKSQVQLLARAYFVK